MQPGFLNYHNSVIHYSYGGQGSKPLICFHGYGETSAKFRFLEKSLGSSYLIIAIDLPFHGDTEWNEGPVYPSALSGLILQLLNQLQAETDNIHLLGFSLGGRLALCVLQEMPQRVSRLVLLAPDGLTVNFWYWLATQTMAGNALFKLTMSRPAWFLGMLRLSNRLRIINQSIFKFVEFYIHDEAVRKSLYERWTGLSKCIPETHKIKNIIRQHQIDIHLLYGKYDRIIGSNKGREFVNGIPHSSIEVLNCGHQVLHEKNAGAIANALLG